MANPYDEVRYLTRPQIQTHPDRLAAVGRLFGMQPAAVDRCRVLEIGCGDGSNLIAMAYALPESRFVGIDLAEAPVRAGQAAIAELGLDNISLRAMDLRKVGPEAGEFDYIVAHGVYSWVAAPVGDWLIEVCRGRLAPQGVAFVSYNAQPGGHVRQMLREMMLHHTRRTPPGEPKEEQARWFAGFLSQAQMFPEAWRAGLLDEIRTALERPAGGLYHDDLANINEPVYFRDFTEHARRHGLQFLCEANPHESFDHRGVLDWLGDDAIEREQYLDFLKARRFRQTLLCRAEVKLERKPGPERMDGFYFSSPAQRLEGDGIRFQGANGVRIAATHADVEAVARTLGETFPLPLSFADLLPYASAPDALRGTLFAMVTGGFAELHAHEFPCEEEVTEMPRASSLARLQARDSRVVSSLCHRTVELDEIGRELLLLLDGSRNHAAIAEALAARPDSPPADEILRHLPQSLDWMARAALLEG